MYFCHRYWILSLAQKLNIEGNLYLWINYWVFIGGSNHCRAETYNTFSHLLLVRGKRVIIFCFWKECLLSLNIFVLIFWYVLQHLKLICQNFKCIFLKHIESPILTTTTPATPATTTSPKASSGDISGTKGGIIDPLVSKRPKKFWKRKFKKKENT